MAEKQLLKDHLCIHEREFGELTASLPRIEGKIDTLCTTVLGHTTVIAQLIEFQINHNGEKKGKEDAEIRQHVADALLKQTAKDTKNEQSRADDLKRQKKRDGWQRWMWVIMAVFGFLTLVLGMYFGFRDLNKGQEEIKGETKITNEVLSPTGRTKGASYLIIPSNDSIIRTKNNE